MNINKKLTRSNLDHKCVIYIYIKRNARFELTKMLFPWLEQA